MFHTLHLSAKWSATKSGELVPLPRPSADINSTRRVLFKKVDYCCLTLGYSWVSLFSLSKYIGAGIGYIHQGPTSDLSRSVVRDGCLRARACFEKSWQLLRCWQWRTLSDGPHFVTIPPGKSCGKTNSMVKNAHITQCIIRVLAVQRVL